MLFVKGIDINTQDNLGQTPLHMAVRYQPEAVPLLLSVEGIDVNVKSCLKVRYHPKAITMVENYMNRSKQSDKEIVLKISELLADTDRIIIIINK
jgi:ankyrin repeat protein